MNPIKSPHQLLLEEAGASLDPSPGLVNTPQQMLMQQANILPHLAPGGSANKIDNMVAPSSLPNINFDVRSIPSMTGQPGVGYMQTPQGTMARMQIEKELENARLRAGVSAMGMAIPGQQGVKVMPGQIDIGANMQIGPGNLDLSTNRSINPIPGRGHMQGVKANYSIPFANGGYIDNLSPADMQAAMVVNGNTPQHFATGGQSIAGLYNQGVANKAAYDKELADKARAEEATYQNQPPVWQAIPNQDTYSIKARNAFAKQLANLTGNERWSEDTTNDIFGGGADEPLTRSNAIPKAVKTAVQFANPVSTITDIMDAPKEVASQANEGNYLGAGITAGFTGLAALPYFKPAKKLISPVLKKIK